MPQRISSIAIPANPGWKICDDASAMALFEAAIRVVQNGGDCIPGKEKEGVTKGKLIVNLRSNDEILNGMQPLYAPTVQYERLCVVDRDEIEGYRSIYELLRGYLKGKTGEDKPLSIAVFGPPGSGKSYGVKQVAKAVDKERVSSESLDFNLAQFSSPNELGSAFLQIRDRGTGAESVPLAFFDEFDSSLGGEQLAWLRYFLSPMQDGEFFYDSQRLHVGRAILVFAGGTAPNLRTFSREEGSSEQDRGRFIEAKGPDFVSRLSGSINVIGINRRDDMPDQAFVLRRAVIIRANLEEMDMVGKSGRSFVDKRFIQKLLEVGRYKHGTRSLVMIIKMCVRGRGVIRLPPAEQLMMHVDKSDADMLLS